MLRAASWVISVRTLAASSDSTNPAKNPTSFSILIGVIGSSSGGSDPHYQVFLELKGVRNLTEEQRYKVTRQPLATWFIFLTKFCGLSQPCLSVGHLSPTGLSGLQVLPY